VKRSGPLKRKGWERKARAPLKRTTELARTEMKRVASPLARKPFRRRKPPPRPPEGPMTPQEWKLVTFTRQGFRCAITNKPLSLERDDAHHLVRKSELRKRGHFDRVWDPRNSLGVRAEVHERHTTGAKRITRDKLPQRAWDFARELDEREGTQWATAHIEREHPQPKGGRDER
jgi:hypothetical protein